MYKENLPKELWYDKSDGYKKWDSLFGKGVNRISIPLKDKSIEIPSSTPLMEEINSVFIPLGYQINSFEDYLNNKVYKISDTKNPMKIGGLLNKINPTLFKKYDTSIERKEWKDKINNSDKDLKIVISRHPYDILGMSSGRDWRLSSCMRLGSKDDKVYLNILASMGEDRKNEKDGGNKNSIKSDIIEGVLVAYVVKVDDNNINNPISRVLIKPYLNKRDDTDIMWVSSDKLYGQSIEGFKSSVDEWLGSWQGGDFEGLYCIKPSLYADQNRLILKSKPNIESVNKLISDFMDIVLDKGAWKINGSGEIDVDGDVWMRGLSLTEIPVKFGVVNGNFDCWKVGLTTLKNCPVKITGVFNCCDNNLTSLQHSPNSVGISFDCRGNNLKSLIGGPTYVGFHYNCSSNDIVSLKGAPISLKGEFECRGNNLTSLEFAPKKATLFNCYGQKNGHKFTAENIREVCELPYGRAIGG